MAIDLEYRFGIDWNRDGVICWGSEPSDPRNLLERQHQSLIDDGNTNLTNASLEYVNVVPAKYSIHMIDITATSSPATVDLYTDGLSGVALSTDQVLSVWLSCADATNIGTVIVTVYGISTFPVVENHVTSGTEIAAAGEDGLRVNLPYNTSEQLALSIYIETTGAVEPIRLMGMMLVNGTAIVPHNTGDDVSSYENITPYVLSASASRGKSSNTDFVASVGTIELSLKNDTRIFSPDYTGGPLYGYHRKYMPIRFEALQNDVWNRLWSGYTDTYDLTAGQTNSRDATITGFDIVNRLSYIASAFERLSSGTVDVAINSILSDNLELSPDSVIMFFDQGWFDINPLSGEDALQMGSGVGTNTLNYLGRGWDDQDTADQVFASLMEAEFGMLLVDRNGRLTFFNQDWPRDSSVLDNIEIGVDVVSGDYTLGQEGYSGAVVTYDKQVIINDGIIWQLENPYPAQKGTTQVQEITTDVDIVALNVIPFIGNTQVTDWGPPYSWAYIDDQNDLTAPSNEAAAVGWTLAITGENTFTLTTNFTSWNPLTYSQNFIVLDIVIRGDAVGFEEGTVYSEDADTSDFPATLYVIQNPNIVTEASAAQAVAEIVNYRNVLRGYFSEITMIVKDAATLDYLVSWDTGTKIEVSEYQSALSDSPHMIVGVDYSYAEGVVTGTYKLEPVYE